MSCMELRNKDEDLHEGGDGHRESQRDDDDDVFLSLSCGSSSSSSSSSSSGEAAGGEPRRHRRRRGQAFECRTCGRQFETFQALGGHRTSHLRRFRRPTTKPKHVVAHACATCGLGFSTGQALGGHMRRHRWAANAMVPPGDLDLTHIIVHGDRPRSASLLLLDLFV